LNSNQNYKALLDNLLRKELYYKIKKNNDLFVATIYDNEKNLGVGKAKKIKEAKMLAAQAAYNSLKK
jgi:dsRNA-specific ribonuclease